MPQSRQIARHSAFSASDVYRQTTSPRQDLEKGSSPKPPVNGHLKVGGFGQLKVRTL